MQPQPRRVEENLSSEILISSDPWENRVAILEDGQLAELYVEREEKVIGSIFKGKVHNVLPGMGAAFVDIGLGRNAFLYVDDINKQPLNIGDVEITQGHGGFTISEKVKRGDDVLVQIVKEPRGLKGARISTNISLPGRYLILMPTGKYSGVSRKIESADERNRLKSVMKRIRPEGMATVVRTAAAGVSEAELIADLGVLIRMWHGILERYKRAQSPSLLHKDMNLIYKAARDFITADVERVLIDDEEEFRKVRDFLQLLGPQYIDRIEYYNSGRTLFDDYKIDAELQKLMKPKINLPSGASIVIESTEALTVIDVNSGKFTGGRNLEDTILKTNIEAAEEIARQVRLRDIGGIIVVDFIDMASEASRDRVIRTMEEVLSRDRTRATIQSFSNLGLLEFTRKRIGKDLGAQLRGACPTCAGMGSVMSSQSVAIETFRRIRAVALNGAVGDVIVHVAPTVAVQMDFWYDEECKELAKSIERPIFVRVDPMIHPEKARIETVTAVKREKEERALRVGDEHEVELLPGRLPNPTSSAAIVDGRVTEVENAANSAGNFVRIRILDVDGEKDYILAEMVTAGAKPRRKRPARGAEVSAAEQTRQLRELAEDAARQSAARPPIGITSLTEEEEAQDKALSAERRGEAQPDAIIIVEGAVQRATAEGDAHRKRRRRRRGGRGREKIEGTASAPMSSAPMARPPVTNAPTPAEAEDAPGDGSTQHRRRRRRGRGRGGRGGLGPSGGAMPDRQIFEVTAEGAAQPTGATAPPEPSRAIATRGQASPPAVEAPPPSLSAPAEKPKLTKPARRRTPAPGVPAELEGAARAIALPAPDEKSTRRPRKKVAIATPEPEPVVVAKPKRSRAAPAADGKVKKSPTKRRVAAKKSTK